MTQSAGEGNKYAQYSLGCWFLNGGEGVPVNVEMAIRYLKLAADQGELRSLCTLATIFATGQVPSDSPRVSPRRNPKAGVVAKKNVREAIRLYKLAAAQGYAEAQRLLGELYLKGDEDGAAGVKKDITEAKKLLALAAAQGDAKAVAYLADDGQLDGDRVTREVTN
jgi:TPR repeat protein